VEEHGIRRESIDRGALFITRTLHRNGFEAYVVGGAVRDLLLGKVPKDFDIATNALPRRIKKMFRNAHVIGKRFRLVHVPMGDDIIEVSTFRALTNGQPAAGDQGTDENNVYGTLDEDVLRRDFTFNALYYSPVNETIIDFVGGVKDIRAKRIRCLIPRKEIFRDDPVRIIRAIKYSSMAGFTIPFLTRLQIAKDAPLIRDCSHSRLTEELFKILKCGSSSLILRNARRLKVLSHLLPGIDAKISRTRVQRAQKPVCLRASMPWTAS
jgi:poly(A) polymerase